MESYSHHYAKHVLREWLTKKWIKCSKTADRANFYIFDWNIDHRDDNYGIYLEYPIVSSPIVVSDQSNTPSTPITHSTPSQKEFFGINATWKNYPDLSEKSLKSNNLTVEAIIDLVICDNGKPKYGIEVVHKHICSAHKRKFLSQFEPEFKVYEISSSWIMSQLCNMIPGKLPLIGIN